MFQVLKAGIFSQNIMPMVRFKLGAPIGCIIFAVGYTGINYENPSKQPVLVLVGVFLVLAFMFTIIVRD